MRPVVTRTTSCNSPTNMTPKFSGRSRMQPSSMALTARSAVLASRSASSIRYFLKKRDLLAHAAESVAPPLLSGSRSRGPPWRSGSAVICASNSAAFSGRILLAARMIATTSFLIPSAPPSLGDENPVAAGTTTRRARRGRARGARFQRDTRSPRVSSIARNTHPDRSRP